jgi:hypothetical protein
MPVHPRCPAPEDHRGLFAIAWRARDADQRRWPAVRRAVTGRPSEEDATRRHRDGQKPPPRSIAPADWFPAAIDDPGAVQIPTMILTPKLSGLPAHLGLRPPTPGSSGQKATDPRRLTSGGRRREPAGATAEHGGPGAHSTGHRARPIGTVRLGGTAHNRATRHDQAISSGRERPGASDPSGRPAPRASRCPSDHPVVGGLGRETQRTPQGRRRLWSALQPG